MKDPTVINAHGFQITDKHRSLGSSVPVSLFSYKTGHMSLAEAKELLANLGKAVAVADRLNS